MVLAGACSSATDPLPRGALPLDPPAIYTTWWEEVEGCVRIEDFRIDNVLPRLKKLGDLWKPVIAGKKRFDLRKVFEAGTKKAK